MKKKNYKGRMKKQSIEKFITIFDLTIHCKHPMYGK